MRVGIFWNIQNIKILKESQLQDILDAIRKKIKYDDRDIEVECLLVLYVRNSPEQMIKN
jgi:hypothetical protein